MFALLQSSGFLAGVLMLVIGALGIKFPGLTVGPNWLFRSVIAGIGVIMIIVGLFVR